MAESSFIAEFSPDAKLFACIDHMGKLKIWDTEGNQMKQEFVPNLHLASPITCIKWLGCSGWASRVANKKKKTCNDTYLALGTGKGKLVMYSYARGEIERTMQGGHSNAITDLYYDTQDCMFSSGLDSKLIRWSLDTGGMMEAYPIGKEKPTAITIGADIFVTAVKQIKVWDVEDMKIIKTLTGHQANVNKMEIFKYQSKNYCVSFSRAERNISLWSLEDDSTNAIGSFVTEDSVYHLSLEQFSDRLNLSAVNRNGVAQIFVQKFDKIKASKPTKKKTSVQIVTDDQQVLPIVASHLRETLVIAYGDFTVLKFERLTPDYTNRENILTREDPKSFKASKEEMAHNTIVPIVQKNKVEYLNPISSSRKATKTTETPLETRLENISISGPPQPKNMVRLLMQGLHSKDSTILQNVFQITDEEAISRTLQKLPPQHVGILVSHLSDMLQKRTTQVNSAVNWLKILIQVHTSQLMALGTDHLKDVFAVCLGVIDHRVAHMNQLMTLRGRLDLLVTQLKRCNKAPDDIDTSNLLVYEDESDQDGDQGLSDNEEEDAWTESDSGNEDGNSVDEEKEEMDVSE